MKNKYLIYKVTSNAHSGLKREFTTLAEAVRYARCLGRDGWWATVTDMRIDKNDKKLLHIVGQTKTQARRPALEQ